MRVYDGRTGILTKVFADFASHQKPSDVTAFCMDSKCRRFYLGGTDGQVRSFNATSGVLIKSFPEEVSKVPGSKKGFTPAEIPELVFAGKDQLLLTISSNSVLSVYDEGNFDSVARLRRLTGGHLGVEVRALAFSRHLSLVATGAVNGSVTVWDYEMSRVEGVCVFHTKEILKLKFAEPYPCLISSSADGFICVWSVRGDEMERRYTCLCCLVNLQVHEAVSASATPEIITFAVDHQPIDFESTTFLSEQELKQRYTDFLKKEGTISKFQDEKTKSKIQFLDNSKLTNTPSKETLRALLITGDEKGRVRIWDLTQLFAYYSIRAVRDYARQFEYYNPKRNEDVNATLQTQMMHRK